MITQAIASDVTGCEAGALGFLLTPMGHVTTILPSLYQGFGLNL